MNSSTSSLNSSSSSLNITPFLEYCFQGPYLRQNWSIPDSMIYYITKNPSTSKFYQKIIQCCKYFFAKNSIIVCSMLWLIEKKVILPESVQWISGKNHVAWITDCMLISEPKKYPILQYIYRSDAKRLEFQHVHLSCKEFMFFASNAEWVHFDKVVVKNSDGSIMTIEKIVEYLTNVKYIEMNTKNNVQMISKQTVKNLIKIPHFLSIDNFGLYQISEVFDIEAFYKFLKENDKQVKYELYFCDQISETFKVRLIKIIDEIIENEHHQYTFLLGIFFSTLDVERTDKLMALYSNIKKNRWNL